jgi:hypothetical protein
MSRSRAIFIAILGLAGTVLTGCAGVQSTLTVPPPNDPVSQSKTQPYAIYVSQDANRRFSSASPVIAAYAMAGHTVNAVPGSPFVNPGGAMQLLPAAGGTFLFANNSDVDPQTGAPGLQTGIFSFKIAPDGSWPRLSG